MTGILFWFFALLFILSMLMAVGICMGYIFFVFFYEKEVRSIIMSLPDYKPNWLSLVDFTKSIKPWNIIGAFFFVDRISVAVFGRKTSPDNELFKSRLSDKIILWLKYLYKLNGLFLIFFLVSISYFWFQH